MSTLGDRNCIRGAQVLFRIVNEALRQKFLDLKEGAVVVSLKCLMGSVRSAARERSASPALKERNVRLPSLLWPWHRYSSIVFCSSY